MSHDAGEPVVLLTCEHGGRDVPTAYRALFQGGDDMLDSHRGFDIGAVGVAQHLAARLAAPLVFATTTRLLVDLNRSIDQPDAFSTFTRDVPPTTRQRIIADHYEPYRANVTRLVDALVADQGVVHLGVHSCTDELGGVRRDLDIALLFDPDRPREARFCQRWRDRLATAAPLKRYRFNEPYRGTDDGLTTTLRQRFPAERYLGIEIEILNTTIRTHRDQQAIANLLAETLPTLDA